MSDIDVIQKSLKELADIKYALDASSIIAITDAKGDITYVNDTFCRISKYSREELLGQNHRIINSGYHPPEFFQNLWQTIVQGQVWKGEVRNRAKDGSFYWVDTTIVPFLDDRGKPYQYVSIRHEISGRKRMETELRKLYEEMEERVKERTQELELANKSLQEAFEKIQESEKLRATFVATLTHDLRTPLVAQQRAIELLLGGGETLTPRRQGLLERLQQSNEGLLDMVNRLLETYQYEAGKVHILPECLSLEALVNECLAHLQPLAQSRQISLTFSVSEDLPDVWGDKHQLRRVLTNLVGNALENIPAGCDIRIWGEPDPEGESLRICVSDNGPGIPPESLPHLFERYSALTNTRKKIGTGLGLYICKMIMALHHGTITVDSRLGEGTCFTLTLPLQAREKQEIQRA